MSTGERLRELRNEKDVSIEEVARVIGMSYSAVAMYERGERVPPTDKLMILARYYGVSAAYLLGETDRPESIQETGRIQRIKDEAADTNDDMTSRLMKVLEDLASSLKEREETERARIEKVDAVRAEAESKRESSIERLLDELLNSRSPGRQDEEAAAGA